MNTSTKEKLHTPDEDRSESQESTQEPNRSNSAQQAAASQGEEAGAGPHPPPEALSDAGHRKEPEEFTPHTQQDTDAASCHHQDWEGTSSAMPPVVQEIVEDGSRKKPPPDEPSSGVVQERRDPSPAPPSEGDPESPTVDEEPAPQSEGAEEEEAEEQEEEGVKGQDSENVPSAAAEGMPRELTMLFQIEHHEMWQPVKVRMPEGTRPGQKISFTYAKRQHEAMVPDPAQEGQEILFTVCAKRPPLERNQHFAARRGRMNIHCGWDRQSIVTQLRHGPHIPIDALNGQVLKSPALAERILLYKYLMGRNMDPILPGMPEGNEPCSPSETTSSSRSEEG